jgi:hypothetical protein
MTTVFLFAPDKTRQYENVEIKYSVAKDVTGDAYPVVIFSTWPENKVMTAVGIPYVIVTEKES